MSYILKKYEHMLIANVDVMFTGNGITNLLEVMQKLNMIISYLYQVCNYTLLSFLKYNAGEQYYKKFLC